MKFQDREFIVTRFNLNFFVCKEEFRYWENFPEQEVLMDFVGLDGLEVTHKLTYLKARHC
jgi:hypothetical protein